MANTSCLAMSLIYMPKHLCTCLLTKMKQLLDFFGAPFVYRSPVGLQGFRAGLMQLSNRQLQPLADTQSHVKKSVLVDRIIADMK